MHPYTKTLNIVIAIVLFGEWTAEMVANYGSFIIGVGLACFAGLLIYSLINSKKVKP